MKKILFDASIHLGQFCLTSEGQRIGCKNSQVSISNKGEVGVVGIVTFNENSWADHVIWELERETQDMFYKFMDVFHSTKNIQRIPLTAADTDLASEMREKYSVDISHALTCTVAIRLGADEIHTLYKDMFTPALMEHLENVHSTKILAPVASTESVYSRDLEEHYQGAFSRFRSKNIDLLAHLRDQHR